MSCAFVRFVVFTSRDDDIPQRGRRGPRETRTSKPGRSARPLRHGIELGLQAFLRVGNLRFPPLRFVRRLASTDMVHNEEE